jgi:hypothetical protein
MVTRIAQLPTIGLLGLAFGIWLLGFFVISPIFQNIGYSAFLLWEMVSPTLITVFIYVRSVRRERSTPKKIQLHVAWLVTLSVVIYLGRETWVGYNAMDDAPRGLLWDFYQFSALLLGAGAFWICYGIGLPFIKLSKPAKHRVGLSDPPADAPSP